MTLGMAWVRNSGSVRELVVASDSRLSGGKHWDGNPKIMLLPRSDAVLSFAGDTNDAYPLMLQAFNTIGMYPPATNRSMDLSDLKGHLIRVFNHARTFINKLPRGQVAPDDPDAKFMLCGYSWKAKSFRVWTLHYDRSRTGFTFRPAKSWPGQPKDSHKLIAYVGDKDAVAGAKERLVALLRDRGKLSKGSLDMEPLEVLRDIISEESFPSVGGPLQVVKVYEHANAVPVGILWPDKASATISVLGRPLMDYEKIPWGVIDPDNPGRAYAASDLNLGAMDALENRRPETDG